jgi:hypothetical protein
MYHVHDEEIAVVFFVCGLVKCMYWIIHVFKLSMQPPPYYQDNQECTVIMYHSYLAMYTFTLYRLGIGNLNYTVL